MKKILVFLVCCVMTTAVAMGGERSNTSVFTPRDTSWKKLSVREKIGQTMVILSRYFHHSKRDFASLDTFFYKYPVGGLFVADWYFDYFSPKDSSKLYYLKKGVEEYAAHSKLPLILMEDFERGIGSTNKGCTVMPVEMSLGATRNNALAYDYGSSIAMQSKELGINWLLHPVADLNMNPLHSLLNERTISDDPAIASPLLNKQINGMKDQHIIATVKHFPGDGATMRDQHLHTAVNNLDMKQWKATYGALFQSLIDNGAPSVMVGHITFPAYQKKLHNGRYLPSTLSSEIVQGLLKKDMGFKGVVVSDAMNMGGAAGYYPTELETSIQSFVAGVDLILWPQLSYMDSVEARILRKEIPMERLDDAVARVWAIREQYGLLQKPAKVITPLSPEKTAFVSRTATEVAQHAITPVRINPGSLPLTPAANKNILVVDLSYSNKASLFDPTVKSLQDNGFNVYSRHQLSIFDWNWRMDSLKFFNKIIICFENKYFDPLGSPMLKGDEAGTIWLSNMLPAQQIIGISYSNPYYTKYYLQNANVLINAYSSDLATQEAVVKALTGQIPLKGLSPVNLDNPALK